MRFRIILIPLFLMSACGGKSRPTSMASSGWSEEVASDPRERIAQLHDEIGRLRTQAGLSREPLSDDVGLTARSAPPPAVSPASTDSEGTNDSQYEDEDDDDHAPVSPTCKSTCTLGKSICDNSTSICRIAGELGDDPWANEKCDSGKVSCKEAKVRCDQCS